LLGADGNNLVFEMVQRNANGVRMLWSAVK
jgi:hypothetical protein